jgi:AraC family transcriptional regulator of adaptative response/methylated-DNA-[protein]-cysteine methyltransferase
MIEEADEQPNLDAEAAGMSRFHFHRIFKAVTGVTPKAYADAHGAQRVGQSLGKSATVTEAIYNAGFNSASRFYATSTRRLGMTSTQLRAGGGGTEIRFGLGETSLGAMLVAATEQGIAIQFGDDPEVLAQRLQDRFPNAQLIGGDDAFEQLVTKVVGLVESKRKLRVESDCKTQFDTLGKVS